MKRVTIYIPDDGGIPYIGHDELKREGISKAELAGALKCAMMQMESSYAIAIADTMIRQMQKQKDGEA